MEGPNNPFNGRKKTELNVSREVKSGIVPLKLIKKDIEGMPSYINTLVLKGISGGEFVEVNYKEDVTGLKGYDIALIYSESDKVEAAMRIETVQS